MGQRRTDRNQAAMMAACRAVGCEVIDLHKVGGGVPDLLVRADGRWDLIEVKSGPNATLTPDERRWHVEHPGGAAICWRIEQVFKRLGLGPGNHRYVYGQAIYNTRLLLEAPDLHQEYVQTVRKEEDDD